MDRFAAIVAIVVATLALVACASVPNAVPLRTTVVLMPDEEGKVGAITVTTARGAQKVDEAYSFTTVDAEAMAPSEMRPMGEEAMSARYGPMLSAQPSRPRRFTLYFAIDSTELTEESKALLPAMYRCADERKPTEISIFGHSDSTGTEDRNLQLSAERALAIESLLRKHDPTLGHVNVKFFGDKEPLFPSLPNARQPRNRRVEIQIL